MIRALRARHRETFLALAVVLPVGLAAALLARRAVPLQGSLAAAGLPEPSAPVLREARVRRGDVDFHLRLWEAAGPRGRILELRPERELAAPDVLAYWADSGDPDALPERCVLLGALAGARAQRFEIPRGARAGRVYLYSLGHQVVVASEEIAP